MKNSFVNLLDCTLCDGGYYNNWDLGTPDDYEKLCERYEELD